MLFYRFLGIIGASREEGTGWHAAAKYTLIRGKYLFIDLYEVEEEVFHNILQI